MTTILGGNAVDRASDGGSPSLCVDDDAAWSGTATDGGDEAVTRAETLASASVKPLADETENEFVTVGGPDDHGGTGLGRHLPASRPVPLQAQSRQPENERHVMQSKIQYQRPLLNLSVVSFEIDRRSYRTCI